MWLYILLLVGLLFLFKIVQFSTELSPGMDAYETVFHQKLKENYGLEVDNYSVSNRDGGCATKGSSVKARTTEGEMILIRAEMNKDYRLRVFDPITLRPLQEIQ